MCFFLFLFFLKTGTPLAFFHSEVNFPFCKHDQKIIPSGLQIDSSQIFNIYIFIIWWPSALFRLRFLIIFKVLFIENSTVESDWHVFLVRIEESLLFLLTREHCLVRKLLKSSNHHETELEYKVSFYYLQRSLILTGITSDLFYCLIVS